MSWTLRCIKSSCGVVFTDDSADARCPKCKGKRTRWIPSGIAIGSRAKSIDATTRYLAESYGLSDIPSSEYGMPAKRTREPARTVDFAPVPGWGVKVPINKDGTPGAVCAPTSVSVKIKPSEGVLGKVTLGGPEKNMRLHGRYRPKG